MNDQHENNAQANEPIVDDNPSVEDVHVALVEAFNSQVRSTAAAFLATARQAIVDGFAPAAVSAAAALVSADMLGALAVEREGAEQGEEGGVGAEKHGEEMLFGVTMDMRERIASAIPFYRKLRVEFAKSNEHIEGMVAGATAQEGQDAA